MMHRSFFALSLLVGTPVLSQALKNHNSNAPVDFAADRIEVQDKASRASLSGNVSVRQGDLTLASARMTIAYTGAITNGSPSVSRLDASGGVRVTSPTESATGDFATYDLDRKLITMIGGVTLSQGSSVLHGGRLVIDLTSGRSVVDGRPAASAAGGIGTAAGGRVTGRFNVPQRGQ